MGQSLIQLACDGLHKLNYREVNSNMAVMYSKHIESLENIIIYCHCSATETSNARMLPSSFASHVTQRHLNVSWWKNTGFCACKLYCSVCTEQRMRERIHCPAVKKSFMLMHFLYFIRPLHFTRSWCAFYSCWISDTVYFPLVQHVAHSTHLLKWLPK